MEYITNPTKESIDIQDKIERMQTITDQLRSKMRGVESCYEIADGFLLFIDLREQWITKAKKREKQVELLKAELRLQCDELKRLIK